jgi:putative transposase
VESDGRRRPVHTAIRDRFNTATIVFLTVCTKDRRPVLANDVAHTALREAWQLHPTWFVGRYVIMPDHVHLFCSPTTSLGSPLSAWVKFWKSNFARQTEQVGAWQRDFWDTQLRRGENYETKWRYVLQNPVRAGLVAALEDWP